MNHSAVGPGAEAIAEAISRAEKPLLCTPASDEAKPRLFVENAAPDRTVTALRDILVDAGGLFDRGVPIRLAFDQVQKGTVAQILSPDVLVLLAHRVCRPYALKEKRGNLVEVDARLPRPLAVMYLDWRGEWRLPPLNGIASSPLLENDGAILSGEGYDPASGMWRERVPDLAALVPLRPNRAEAEAALLRIRRTFQTFCFADADLIHVDGLDVVDCTRPPRQDESACLAALLTAVCRPSLPLAPGILIRAAPVSGAGAGKGLLARCLSLIAFGREPHAVTAGSKAEELEKRISAELIEGNPVLMLDNLNNTAFRSSLLASAITERPAKVRILGRSKMVPLNASALVVLTGNGLTVSEDLARRFIVVELDPRTEDPEARHFPNDIRAEVAGDRTELLAAALTIWRWGRIAQLPEGRAFGSFETWGRWVRDPLIALGCTDPVERITETKERDGRRQATAELFATWWNIHGERPVALRQLHGDIKGLIDPQGRGRQYISAQLERLAGTRIAGFVLTRQPASGRWGVATYAMKSVGGPEMHRDHREHPNDSGPCAPGSGPYDPYAHGRAEDLREASAAPMPPMPPMPSSRNAEATYEDRQAEFEERAAIREFDGGFPRAEAEDLAAEEISPSLPEPERSGA